MRHPCMPMARWLFGTSWCLLPGVLGATPAQRHTRDPWLPAQPQGRDRAWPRCPQLLHTSTHSPSPRCQPQPAQGRRAAMLRGVLLPHHTREPGELAGR